MEDTIEINPRKEENSALFNEISETRNKYYSFMKYLITFEVDIEEFNLGKGSNSKTLFVFTDEATEKVRELKRKDVISNDILKRGLSISIDGNMISRLIHLDQISLLVFLVMLRKTN